MTVLGAWGGLSDVHTASCGPMALPSGTLRPALRRRVVPYQVVRDHYGAVSREGGAAA